MSLYLYAYSFVVYSHFTSKPIAIFFNRRMAGTSNTVPTFTEPINLVLFGRVGNGKSSLGNSIIRKTELKNGEAVSAKAFEAKAAESGVTSVCKMETTTLHDGQVVTVIDTPWLFDMEVGVEILKMVLAANGGKPFTNEFFEELKREASRRPETVDHNLNMFMLFQQRIAEINNADLEDERCARFT
ncbi:uncharacterized protein LOC113329584 isoform X2 [Papaver somniferum]|uniref:uncharacterized protein LOC113329584 isoform X2 n=1 Tax=Papaver somniferum TaxID=3469 RepID=UPI000E701169|nr:uncharacterized protein LOC113329584 isoform X2 [Papaver somniferum]